MNINSIYVLLFPLYKLSQYGILLFGSLFILQTAGVLLTLTRWRRRSSNDEGQNIHEQLIEESRKLTIQLDLSDIEHASEIAALRGTLTKFLQNFITLTLKHREKTQIQILVRNKIFESCLVDDSILSIFANVKAVNKEDSDFDEPTFWSAAIRAAEGDFIMRMQIDDFISDELLAKAFTQTTTAGCVVLKRILLDNEERSLLKVIHNVWTTWSFNSKDYTSLIFGLWATLGGDVCTIWNKSALEQCIPSVIEEQNMVTCLQLRGWKVALEDSVVVYNTSTMDLAKEKQLWNKRLRGMTYAFTQNFGKILMSSELGILKKILNIILLLLPWIQIFSSFFLLVTPVVCSPRVPQVLLEESTWKFLFGAVASNVVLVSLFQQHIPMMLFAVFIIPFEYGISLFKGINLLSHLLFKQQPRLLKSPFWNSMIPELFIAVYSFALIVFESYAVANEVLFRLLMICSITALFVFPFGKPLSKMFELQMGIRFGTAFAIWYVSNELYTERYPTWPSEVYKNRTLSMASIIQTSQCIPNPNFSYIDSNFNLRTNCNSSTWYRPAGQMEWTQWVGPTYFESEHITAFCNKKINVHVVNRLKKDVLERGKAYAKAHPTSETRYNVLFLILDSTSTHSFLKHLPKFGQFLKDLPTEDLQAKSFFFDNFNTNGLDSVTNQLAFLGGCGFYDYKSTNISFKFPVHEGEVGKTIYKYGTVEAKYRNAHVYCQMFKDEDYDPKKHVYIWNRYQDAGYATLFGEEICAAHSDWSSQPFFEARGGPLYDHYYGDFMCDEAKDWSAVEYCYGGKLLQNYSFGYIEGFWNNYREIPKHAVIDLSGSHCDHIRQIYTMDEDLTSWVSKFLKRETDTILVIMGDHGSTVNRFIKKKAYPVEKFSKPILQIILPDSFMKSFPFVEKNFEGNLHKLITMHDLYNTFSSIPHFPEYAPFTPSWSHNIMKEIVKEDRTCDEARIPPLFCVHPSLESRLNTDWIPGIQPEPLEGVCWSP